MLKKGLQPWPDPAFAQVGVQALANAYYDHA